MADQEIISLITQLVTIPSTVDNPAGLKQAVDCIEEMIQNTPGVTIERFIQNSKPSLLAYFGAERPGHFDVLFNGHIDVVPGKPEQFAPEIRDGRLYGRGAYDMKAACVIMADVFRNHPPDSSLKLGLQIVADEEVGGYDGVVVQLQAGIGADFIITGEMTDNEICTETRGLCWMDVTFSGKAAHGGYVWHGSNAVAKASEFAQAVIARYPVPTAPTWATTANIAAITTGNSSYNKVPGEATVKIDFRFTPEDPVFLNRESVETFIKSIDPDATVRFENFEPAVKVDHDKPYLRRFVAAYEQATGEPAALIRRYASSDARHFALAKQDCIEFGPVGKNLHGDDEYLELASLIPFRATLETFISNNAPL